MITHNNDEDIHQAFRHAIISNPSDSINHLVYADYLDENNQPEEAEHHRIIGMMIPHSKSAERLGTIKAERIYSVPHFTSSIGNTRPTPNPLIATYRGKHSPLAATIAAVRAGKGIQQFGQGHLFPSQRQARQNESTALYSAKQLVDYSGRDTSLIRMKKSDLLQGYINSILHEHESAARNHLYASEDLLRRSNSPNREQRAALHRRAALAHVYASFVYRRTRGTL